MAHERADSEQGEQRTADGAGTGSRDRDWLDRLVGETDSARAMVGTALRRLGRRIHAGVSDAEYERPTGRDAVIGDRRVPHRTDDWTVLEPDPDSERVRDSPVRAAVVADAREALAGGTVDFLDDPGDPFVEHRLFDFSYLDVADVVEWEWVNEPFAYVAVVRERGDGKLRYLVQEPTLDEFEQYVLADLRRTVRNELLYRDVGDADERKAAFTAELERLVDDHAVAVADDGTLHKLLYYLRRDFVDLGPVDPIMRDDAIEDVSCDGDDVPVFVYRFDHRDLRTNVGFDSGEQLRRFVLRLANQANAQISVANPLVDGSLPDGSRVQLSFGGEISTRGANFTIRKFANVPYTPVQLIDWGTFSVEQMAYFWLAIENNRSLIFAGGTGSGKTTSMNAVSFFVPEDSKVVSIEDTREITLPHDNWVQQVTRDSIDADGQGEVAMYDLLKASLRQRPEYLLVGEIRTDPRVAFSFFQAIGTGHTAYTTLHADSVEGVLNRLENEPLNVSTQMLLDLDVISIQTQAFRDGDRVRRNESVTELVSMDDDGDVNGVTVFERDAERDEIRRLADSQVLRDVARERGWSDADLARELRDRERVLQYLLEEGIDGYREVAAVISAFRSDRAKLLERVESGDLSAADVRGSSVVLDPPAPAGRSADEDAESGDGADAGSEAGARADGEGFAFEVDELDGGGGDGGNGSAGGVGDDGSAGGDGDAGGAGDDGSDGPVGGVGDDLDVDRDRVVFTADDVAADDSDGGGPDGVGDGSDGGTGDGTPGDAGGGGGGLDG
ncbi:MAG: type II/IV secretion system ATPase subunit [Halobacteriales archaeon]